MYPRENIEHVWNGAMTPFRIIGNTYFVGTYQSSSHLIDTGEGLILIDTGYFDSVYLVLESIRDLGFNPHDIKYIIHSHNHIDHVGATKALVELTGAKTFIGEPDAEYLTEQGFFTPDTLVHDGDIISLGNTSVRCVLTPGHTRGTLSFFYCTHEGDKIYKVGMFGGAGVISLYKDYPNYYDECREDYASSLTKLMKEKVDVFIGNHCWNNDTKG